jgi:hypothetical protein
MFWFLPLLAVPTIRDEVSAAMEYGFSQFSAVENTTTEAVYMTTEAVVDILPPFDFLPLKGSPEAANYSRGGKVSFC